MPIIEAFFYEDIELLLWEHQIMLSFGSHRGIKRPCVAPDAESV